MSPVRPGPRRWMAVVSDLVEGPADRRAEPPPSRFSRDEPEHGPLPPPDPAAARARLRVTGGYLERLPLACVKAGLVDAVEIWHHWRGETPPGPFRESEVLTRRVFRLDGDEAPFSSRDMRDFVACYGPPALLVVLGLGVDKELVAMCADSTIVYNSIDAPALRVPPQVSRRFDLVLTAAQWQSDEVAVRHPGMAVEVLPVGPEFADPDLFHPLGLRKDYDVVYVAAAQPYKRHDVLFEALARRPELSALCVFGYGELADAYRRQAADRGLRVDFVGPPGVPHAEVNRLMNRARIGVVCGQDDGAPAILTEYMLAGLPVLANDRLRCGLDFIGPNTGATAPEECFGDAVAELIDRAPALDPRAEVLRRWTWPHSLRRFAAALERVGAKGADGLRMPAGF